MNMLEELRKDIDTLDDHLLELIQKRLILMKATGEAKKRQGKEIRDLRREQEKTTWLEKKANELRLPVNLITKIWKVFFEESEAIEK